MSVPLEKYSHFWNNPNVVKEFGEDLPSEEVSEFILINKGGKILDIGCGGGRNTKVMAENGYEVYAIDPYPGMIDYTKEMLKKNHLSANVFQAEMTSLPFKNNFFDLVVSNGVFHQAESIDEYLRSLKEANRVMVVGGLLYSNVFILNKAIMNKYTEKENEKYSFYTEKNLITTFLPKKLLIELMKEAKLNLVEVIQERSVYVSTGDRTVFKAVFVKTE